MSAMSELLPGYSPSFKKPAEILRLSRRRSRSEAGPRTALFSPGEVARRVPGVRPFSPGTQRSGGTAVKRRNPFASLENTVDAKRRAACLAECDFLVPVVEKENPEPVQVSPGTLRVNRPFIISRQKSANGRAPRHCLLCLLI